MKNRRFSGQEGFTLLELTLAMAVFAIVLGATAQALISYYVTMDMQEQRGVAAQICKGVLSDMRDARNANPGDFPNAIVSQWPDDGTVSGPSVLKGERIVVAYADATANPLEVMVRVSWNDLRGRPMNMQMSTVLTDR